VSAKGASLEYVMDKILHNTSLSYELLHNTLVVISPKANKDIVRSVSGKVTDQNGKPLSGVSILEKGTSNGTTTRQDGTFSITLNNPNAVLVISFMGYETREIKVSDQPFIEVGLNENIQDLED